MRNLRIGVTSWDDSINETREILRRLDLGQLPERPIERVRFHDFKTLLRYITPKRLELLETLHRHGQISMTTLSKLLRRSLTNVKEDVRAMEVAGLIERDGRNHVFVPWSELESCLKLDVEQRGNRREQRLKPERPDRSSTRVAGGLR